MNTFNKAQFSRAESNLRFTLKQNKSTVRSFKHPENWKPKISSSLAPSTDIIPAFMHVVRPKFEHEQKNDLLRNRIILEGCAQIILWLSKRKGQLESVAQLLSESRVDFIIPVTPNPTELEMKPPLHNLVRYENPKTMVTFTVSLILHHCFTTLDLALKSWRIFINNGPEVL